MNQPVKQPNGSCLFESDYTPEFKVADKQTTSFSVEFPNSDPDYIFNEGEIIKELKKYIDSTYNQHYSRNKFQATEFIVDGGHGKGFFIGNILKYAQRYGTKGTPTEWRKDLMKVLHYAIMMVNEHDRQVKEWEDEE